MKVFISYFFQTNFHLLILGLFLFSIHGCTPPSSATVRNYSSLYKSANTEGILNARPLHLNDSTTRVFFKLKTYQTDSIFNLDAEMAHLKVLLFASVESTQPFDSAYFNFKSLNIELFDGLAIGYFDIPVLKKTNYQAEISISNFTPLTKVQTIISLNKLDSIGQFDFLLVDTKTNLPIFNDYVQPQQSVRFESPKKLNQEYEIKLFDRNFGLALPPFGVNAHKPFDYIPDSLIKINFTLGKSNTITFSRTGIYHLELDKITHAGVTCFLFNGSYPSIEKIDQLIFPLRYITSKAEYQSILESDNQKTAIDKFWLARAGNEAKARKMIKEFYSRVEKSNRLFGSFNEGWKTDRGMIYLVYGPPTNTYRNNNFETWIYGFEGTQYSITFNFTKVDNPFTNNDYTLNRSSMYKTSWYQAVESWREGRIALTE